MAGNSRPQVKPLQLLAFIGPCLPFAALGLPLAVTLSEYYVTEIGLSLSLVGWVFLTVKLVDLLIDPLIGWGMDRTRTQWGRFKIWMAICLPLLFVASGFIFLAPKGVSPVYLGIWLFVIYIGFSIAALSQSGWGSVLSSDYDERTRIFSAWQVANIVGIVAVLLVSVGSTDVLGLSYRQSVQNMGYFIMAALPITIGIALWRVPERVSNLAVHDVKLSDYFVMLKRPNVIRILLADLYLGLAPGVMGVLFYFYFMTLKGLDRGEGQKAMALYFIAGLVGAPLWNWVSKRYSKHRALVISSLVFAAVYACLALLPSGNFPLSAAVVFLAGIPYAASLLLTRAMMADIGDEVIAETGHDHKGTLMAILSATTKLGYTLPLITMPALEYLGFDNKMPHDNPGALVWLEIFFIGLPVLFLLLGALAMRGYDLTPERLKAIQQAKA
jgi:Na+/melibiose symporter-like transporter